MESPIREIKYTENTPEWHVQRILKLLGYDVNSEGLIETPRRYIKFLNEFLSEKDFVFKTFVEPNVDEMIVVEGIPFYSLCEHHLAPFFGTATVAYIPKENKIVGLSKIPRTVEKFANKLSTQERITNQVAEFIAEKLTPHGVAVSLKAQHLCMCMRGVKTHDTWTTTTKLTGLFKEDNKARNEFLSHIK